MSVFGEYQYCRWCTKLDSNLWANMTIISKILATFFTSVALFLAFSFWNWRSWAQVQRETGPGSTARYCQELLQQCADRVAREYKTLGLEKALFMNKQVSRDCLDNPVQIEFDGQNFLVRSAGFDRMDYTKDDVFASADALRTPE